MQSVLHHRKFQFNLSTAISTRKFAIKIQFQLSKIPLQFSRQQKAASQRKKLIFRSISINLLTLESSLRETIQLIFIQTRRH